MKMKKRKISKLQAAYNGMCQMNSLLVRQIATLKRKKDHLPGVFVEVPEQAKLPANPTARIALRKDRLTRIVSDLVYLLENR